MYAMGDVDLGQSANSPQEFQELSTFIISSQLR